VGAAVAANPAAILVPCHRVVGARGTLTGYAWGLDLKRRLIAHEALDTPFRLSAPGASRIHEAAPHPAGDPRSLA
jgi:methylated-DNA-[protein]-cysteine S-methyltransferase